MNIETLVVTTNQNDYNLVRKMNIQTDAIIGNQNGYDKKEEIEYRGKKIQYVSSSLIGVGNNRNEVLSRSVADICVLADDDMIFFDNYPECVQYWFEKLPKADVLIFNLFSEGKVRKSFTKVTKINLMNYGKYGAARLVIRVSAIKFKGIMFNTLFGGGAKYSCGEDTLFLRECLSKGLKIYGVPESLAKINDENSSWFEGYTDKYFFDKGILYYALGSRTCFLHSLYHCVRYRKEYKSYGIIKAFKQMKKGIQSLK